MKKENTILTAEEEAFIENIELAIDWAMNVSEEDYQKYLELIKKREDENREKPTITESTESIPATNNTQSFVVCIDSWYVRDAQYFIPEHPMEKGDDIGEKMDSDNNWADADKYNLFVGIYTWNSNDLDGLKAYVAAKHEVYAESILITPVGENEKMKQELTEMKRRYQEGMKVSYEGTDDSDDICCPVCNYSVARIDDFYEMRPHHCPDCGTKLLY